MKKLIILYCFLLTGCLETGVNGEVDIVLPNPFVCEQGWLWDRVGGAVINPNTGAQLTCTDNAN